MPTESRLQRSPDNHIASPSSAPERSVPSRRAARRPAYRRSAERSSACAILASCRFAPVNFDAARSANSKLAPRRSAYAKSAPARFAPARSLDLKCALRARAAYIDTPQIRRRQFARLPVYAWERGRLTIRRFEPYGGHQNTEADNAENSDCQRRPDESGIRRALSETEPDPI